MIRLFIAGAALLAGSAAWGAPATPEEAQRLTGVLERYVGHGAAGHPGPVTVVPHGEAYTATLDVTRLLAVTAGLGFNVTAGDLVAELTPQPDGQWRVTVAGLPPVGLAKDTESLSLTTQSYTFDGLFDPGILAFATSTSTMGGYTTHSSGKTGPLDVTMKSDAAGTTKAVRVGPGFVDQTIGSTSKDVDYRFVQGAAGEALDTPKTPREIARVQMGKTASIVSLQHEAVGALDDLWQFLVAHPSRTELQAAQAELKTRLHAVVPFATSGSGSFTASQIAVTTGLGAFALDSLGQHYEVSRDGKSADTLSLQFAGLSLPDRLVPAWAVPLVPTSLDFTQTSGPVQWSEALSLAIDDLDLSTEQGLKPEQQAAVVEAMRPEHMTVTIPPSSIATALMTLKFQGEVTIDRPAFTGAGTITGTGLDKTIEAVRTAAPNDPGGLQAITMLSAAKALARAEGPDSYSWRIELSPAGALTVNGTPLSDFAAPGAGKGKPRKTGTKP